MALSQLFTESCFIFWTLFCISLTQSNTKITFQYIEQEKTWHEAQGYCRSINGSLLHPYRFKLFSNYTNTSNEIWIGKYTILSSWINVLGCYMLESSSIAIAGNDENRIYITQTKSPAECEQTCQKYPYFGLKVKQCLCMTNITKILVQTNNTDCHSGCGHHPKGECGGGDSNFTVYERVTFKFRERSEEDVIGRCGECKCSVVDCDNELYKTKCELTIPVHVACRPNFYNNTSQKWKDGFIACFQHGAYMADSAPELCSPQDGANYAFWTSILRRHTALNLFDSQTSTYRNATGAKRCFSAVYVNFTYKSKGRGCVNRKNAFVCEIPLTVDTDDPVTTSISNFTRTTDINTVTESITVQFDNSKVPSNNKLKMLNTGMIIGAVVAVVVVCSVVAIILIKKRCTAFRNPKTTEEKRIEFENGGMVRTVENEDDRRFGSAHNNEYEFAKPFDNTPDSKPSYSNNSPSSYEMTKGSSDEDYAYTSTIEGEYDTFHNRNDRKIGTEEGNLYAHTMPLGNFESDYDTTRPQKGDRNSTYDHAKFVRNGGKTATILGGEEDPYDHTNT